jgi:hypothetical protein
MLKNQTSGPELSIFCADENIVIYFITLVDFSAVQQ